MNTEVLKTTILSIVTMGVVITLSGVVLYYFRDQVGQYMRYLLPIPPIGVAAYVFVYNMFGKYDGKLPGTTILFVLSSLMAPKDAPTGDNSSPFIVNNRFSLYDPVSCSMAA